MTRRDLMSGALALPIVAAMTTSADAQPAEINLREIADQRAAAATVPAAKPYEPMLKPFGPRAHAFAYGHPSQDRPITVVSAPIRSCKTFATIVKMVLLSNYECDGLRVLAGCSRLTLKINLLDDLSKFVGASNFKYNSASGEMVLCGVPWLVVGACDEGSKKTIAGKRIGVAIVDEAVLVPQEFVLGLCERITDAKARLYLVTHPAGPDHWIKTDYMDNPGEHVQTLAWTMNENPYLSAEYKEAFEKLYTGVDYRRYILGDWV